MCSDSAVLKLPDTEKPFEVSTDASDLGLGAVLTQEGRVVEFASRRLSRSEENYSVFDRELLAIVWALEKWRFYLFGRAFVVHTDHRPLTYLQSVRNPKGRLARWIARLQEFTFQVKYRPGPANGVADCLSRMTEGNDTEQLGSPGQRDTLPEAMERVSAVLFCGDLGELAREQRSDQALSIVIRCFESGEQLSSTDGVSGRFRQIWDQLFLSEEGCLCRKFRLRDISVSVPVITAALCLQYLEDCHGSAHMGMQKTYDLLRVNAYWPGMEGDVEKSVTTSERCQLHKPSTLKNKAPENYVLKITPL